MPSATAEPLLTERFQAALDYAAAIHRTQLRKETTIPYVSHVLSVAALVLEDGGDEDEAIAALLHDAIEDCGVTKEELERRFGARVARIVDDCTDAYTHPKPPWLERKKKYIEHVRTAPADVRRVAAADKLHNARSILRDFRQIGDAVWERFTGDRDSTLWYYRTVTDTLQSAGGGPLVEQLDRVVTELEREAGGV